MLKFMLGHTMVKDLVLSYWIESSVMERRKLFLSAPTL